MKNHILFVTVLLLSINAYLPAQTLWQDITDSQEISTGVDGKIARAKSTSQQIWIEPKAYTAATINIGMLESILKHVPKEGSNKALNNPAYIDLLLPDGSLETFEIVETFVMHPDLAKRYPQIKTYLGVSVNIDSINVRFDWTIQGFHAQFIGPDGYYYIDPHYKNNRTEVVSYFKEDAQTQDRVFECLTGDLDDVSFSSKPAVATKAPGDNVTRRTYRLACAATGEYTAFHSTGSPTVPEGLAAVVTAINRVVGVMEKEFALRLVLVPNNDLIIFTNSASDPYTNNNGGAMLSQNQTEIDNTIGSANYDLGHVVSTGGGGVASIDVACSSNWKARGVTGQAIPVGEDFTIGYICHEMGHQLGASHTFNGVSGNCSGGNRSSSTAYEPGSGSTIMSYGDICGVDDNIPYTQDDYYLWISIQEITNTGTWASCGVHTTLPNHHPTVLAGAGATIPIGTPFELTPDSYDDQDGDILTFCWEQADKGAAQSLVEPDNGESPLFRSWNPTIDPTRTFPRLENLLNNTMPIGEKMPALSRSMAMKITVRDNALGGGGTAVDDLTVTISDVGGPFLVTSQNIATIENGTINVTWDVANTTAPPISTDFVNIFLSTDSGYTFDIILVTNTPNDGAETVAIPHGALTTTARIKVAAANSIYFDINNVDFTIASVACNNTCGDIDGAGVNVDIADFGLFAGCWNKNTLTNLECECANLVEFDKHIIDLLDLSVFAELFLSSSTEYPPNNCSSSITDPYPPSPDPGFAVPPYPTGATSIVMTASISSDTSGVQYYFTCTGGGGNNSTWQAGTTYIDTALTPDTTYTYTVKARDLSVNYNETADSGPASATTEKENILLPANGGVLESFTSEYGQGWVASDLTNGVINEDGWASEEGDPVPEQEFVYSFRDDNDAILDHAVIHGGTAEGSYYSKDVEVWVSADGSIFTFAGSDTLLEQDNDFVTIPLGGVTAKKVKLVITSGYLTDFWELSEFIVNGEVINP